MSIFRKNSEPPIEPESVPGPLHKLYQDIEDASLPEYALKAAQNELERLEKTDPSVAEYSVGLNYLNFVLSLPWNKAADDNLDLDKAEQILDAEHHGLTQVKERVLEHLAANIMRRSKPAKILVVDDEPIALENLAYTLKKEKYEVSTAVNGKEALDRCTESTFDLVVTDLKMQQMDGIQLLELVRKKSPSTAFIITTGYATVETAVDALKKGAAHYLPKPVKLETLKQTVSKLLSERREFQLSPGSVLCFAGPPGIGKTSVGRSIANAFNRKFICLSMAGLRDEAELRGHRRTYVGAMPGRILSEIQKSGDKNPVFMLDELDKIGQDFRGDPASVLLEVLDPKQNNQFLDYYLDMPFDLSQIMFVTTANLVEKLPAPLLDRMEIIPFSSYTMGEKRKIAQEYLIPRQLETHGLNRTDLTFTEKSLDTIIQGYTREAGLRNLDREIASICRKMDRLIFKKEVQIPTDIDKKSVESLLGPPPFSNQTHVVNDRPGVTTGLVWTEFGGQIIFIETAIMRGNRNLIMTGSLGEVLKESAQTALSFIRSSADQFGIDPDFFTGCDVHVHIPAGSIPKDGPSAGVTIAVALISLLTNRPSKGEIAMSGELTLSGQILPVSGLREKVLAAQQAGITTVVLPKRNESGIKALDEEVRQAANIVLAESVESIVELVLEPSTQPIQAGTV
jgi:ATP-dependent Lon protease